MCSLVIAIGNVALAHDVSELKKAPKTEYILDAVDFNSIDGVAVELACVNSFADFIVYHLIEPSKIALVDLELSYLKTFSNRKLRHKDKPIFEQVAILVEPDVDYRHNYFCFETPKLLYRAPCVDRKWVWFTSHTSHC
jgi:hypothetical protein